MQCPDLDDLPAPPPGRLGWPWTEGSLRARSQPTGKLPRISIITPSYNQGEYIEETIRSVLLQAYGDYELIVVDGGSSDATREILEKYSPWISYHVSEPDHGQSHAINKGIHHLTGDIWNWLNSDDVLVPGAFHVVATAFEAHPDTLIVGDAEEFWNSSSEGERYRQQGIDQRNLVEFWAGRARWYQPGIFSPVARLVDTGLLDESLDYSMDYDFLCRIAAFCPTTYLDCVIVRARLHGDSKTVLHGHRFALQNLLVSSRYWDTVPGLHVPSYVRKRPAFMLRQACRWAAAGHTAEARNLLKESLHAGWWDAIAPNIRAVPSLLRAQMRKAGRN